MPSLAPRRDPRSVLLSFLKAYQEGERVALATVISSARDQVRPGDKLLVRPRGDTEGNLPGLAEAVKAACLRVLKGEEGEGLVALEGAEVYIEAATPPATLLIAGAGHIGQALSRLAKLLGFTVAVVDDRPDFANAERFPEADQVICADFVAALSRFPIHKSTYVVLVTRGHRHDEICLRTVLLSPAAYVGMIGSRRRVATVLRHLGEEGLPQERLDQVYSPIGLDIGAETPEEIALSILAEMVRVRRGGSGRSLKEIRRETITLRSGAAR